MDYKSPNIVAEICCNHQGDMEIAKQMIKVAADGKATVAKFQKRSNKEFLTEDQFNAPHPNKMHSFGEPYGAHREFLEFSLEEHLKLKEYCEEINVDYSTSVWDVTSAKEISQLNPNLIKVPSACNNHFDMLAILRDEYSGDVHISLGMTTKDEEKKIINFFNETNSLDRLIIYACTSGYPVPFKQTCLLEISRLINEYDEKVKSIGFSGHHLGIAIDVAAYTLGANWIERHFTKDRTWKGTDHAASLEPAGLSKLTRDLKASYNSLTYKDNDILDIEAPQREKLKWKER